MRRRCILHDVIMPMPSPLFFRPVSAGQRDYLSNISRLFFKKKSMIYRHNQVYGKITLETDKFSAPMTDEIPTDNAPAAPSRFGKMLMSALLSLSSLSGIAQGATPAKKPASPAAKTATIVSTNVKKTNTLDVSHIKGSDGRTKPASITHDVAHYMYEAENARRGKDPSYDKKFYRGMFELMKTMEKAEPLAYIDPVGVLTIGIGFNMQIPLISKYHPEIPKENDLVSRRLWKQIFGEKGPDFDACKSRKCKLSMDQMQQLFEGMMKDMEGALHKKFDMIANRQRRARPGERFRNYGELRANERAALLSLNYQSPRLALRMCDELSADNLKGATKELMATAGRYSNRRGIEDALLNMITQKVSPSQLAASVMETVNKAKWDNKSVIHAYAAPGGQEQKGKIKDGLKPKKNKSFVVSTHGDGGKETHYQMAKAGKAKPNKAPGRS